MKAFVVERYGDADTVQARDVPEPAVGDDDVLVRVHAASVNPLDLKIRAGDLKAILPYRAPFVLGNDLAGTVVAVGSRVTRFAVGDEVYARPDQHRIGAFAELIAMHQDDVAAKPVSLTMTEAASFPLVGLTAWQALVERADLRPGQRVLIHAGAGGVGTVAVQLAKHLGAHVAATASGAKAELVRSLGADVVVDYTRQAFETVLHDYDVVLDTVGGDTLDRSLRVLKPGGIVVSVAGPPDPAFARQVGASPVVRLAVAALSFRVRRRAQRRRVRYSYLFMRASGDQLRELTALLDAATIRPVVDRVFDFASTRDALAHVEQGRARAGKVVIRMTA
ncbi:MULTISPECIES: NADP-dependent oxidoreductase [Catenuloplanes]|uniref:NADPH:quinone reductase-like Zn-dependent oxidoreductase n=1 Tax=Catenuloplanes niger TaxID=587534 RepID=A0AAE3ZY12_9ACTN|nr:NADP-dependent oxidoreductase [Catenuloplanes niger]MDR7328012.1 NADPH:quinone reductase-like Zn-dependent oxidoreductase [Catenuloplanes niger]